MTQINLVPAYRIAAAKRRLRMRTWLAVDAMCCGGLLAAALIAAALLDRGGENLHHQLALMQAEINSRNQAVSAFRPMITEARQKLEASRAVTAQPDWSVLLAFLGKLRGEDIVFSRCQLMSAQGLREEVQVADESGPHQTLWVLIEGFGLSQTAVSRFILDLEEVRLFDMVKVIHTKRQAFRSAEAVAFQLRCVLTEGGRDH